MIKLEIVLDTASTTDQASTIVEIHWSRKTWVRIAAKSTLGKAGNLLKHPLVLGNSLLKCSNHLAEEPADCTHYLLQIEVGITKRKGVMMVGGDIEFSYHLSSMSFYLHENNGSHRHYRTLMRTGASLNGQEPGWVLMKSIYQ